jgi:hypothetical protein
MRLYAVCGVKVREEGSEEMGEWEVMNCKLTSLQIKIDGFPLLLATQATRTQVDAMRDDMLVIISRRKVYCRALGMRG